MSARLTEEQQRAVDENRGFLEVEGVSDSYVLISMQAFREMMGVGTDREYQSSLAAIREGLDDIDGGRTRPMSEFFAEFDRKHGLQD